MKKSTKKQMFFFPTWILLWASYYIFSKKHSFRKYKPNLKTFSRNRSQLYETISFVSWLNVFLFIVLIVAKILIK